MIRYCLGLLLLSGTWLFLFPVFMPSARWLSGIVLAASGTALMALSERGSARPPDAQQRGGAPSFETLQRTGAGAAAERGDRAWSGSWKSALVVAPLVLAWQFLALQGTRAWASRHHDLNFLSPVVAAVARLFGLKVRVDQNMVFFETEEDALPFATNWEKLGWVMPLGLCVALTVTTLLQRRGVKALAVRWLGGVAVLSVYMLVRYLILCGWLIEFGDAKGVTETDRLTLFTGAWPTLLSYLPFAFLMGGMRLAGPGAPGFKCFAGSLLLRPIGVALAAALASVFVGIIALKICWAGPAKEGRILIDDAHSGFWEPAQPALGTNGFGSDYLYNCSSLVEWLRHSHPVEVNAHQSLTEQLLHNIDVLVLKTPTRRFGPEEIAVVLAFVRRGGGLLLIGDHTNLLGMSSFLNEIAAPFGIRFRYDASNAYLSGYFSSFSPPWLFAHPIVEGLPPLRFLTSCTLEAAFSTELVVISHDVMSDPMDYSKPSFFGKLIPNPRNGFGLFPLAVARRYGQGRVVAFAESTTLSNFAVFQDGTAAFILRAVAYLNQTQRDRSAITWTLQATALLLLGAAGWQLGRAGATALITGLAFAGIAGYVGAGLALKVYHSRTISLLRPALPCDYVAILQGGQFSFYVPPAIGPSFLPAERSFDALYVVPQRFGCFPEFASLDQLQPRQHRAAVAINPVASASPRDFQKLANYLAAGGQLLVFQEPGGELFLTNLLNHARGHRLLFEREFSVPSILTNAVFQTNSTATTIAGTIPPGGTPAVPGASFDPSAPHRLTWSAWSIQSGAVHVLSDSRFFSRAWLGNVMVEPSEAQRRVYDIVFAVFTQSLRAITRPEKTRAELR